MSYLYRRDDNGEVVDVGFAQMLDQKDGFIILPDGSSARRCVHLEIERDRKFAVPVDSERRDKVSSAIVSDALGFTAAQYADFEADRVKNKFSGVEFKKDPTCPWFYQAHFSSWAARDAYMKHRQLRDNNSKNGSGATLTREQLEAAAEMLMRGDAPEKQPATGDG